MDAAATWANERWHDLELGTLFAFDESWANRAWNDLELFATIDSNVMAYNNLQTVQNLASRREVDLHKCISLLESNVQAPLTAACEDAAADDEHSDTNDEDQHVEYREYNSSVHGIVGTNRRQWWPLCTASRLRPRTIWEQLYDEQGNPRITFPASVQSHRERLFEILRCFKIQKKPGLLPVLIDSGSTCVITSCLRQVILRIPNKTIISGVGTGSVSFASPIIFTAVASTGQFEMFNFLTGYFMTDLDFAIMPCAPLERAGYEFTLSASFSRTRTPLVSWCLLYVMLKQVSIS
jgi:hypothetical protein